MALILKKVYDGYRVVFDEWSDPRTNKFPLMSSPFPTLAILIFYLYFVKDIGPRLMLYREPFKLKKLMILYNALQIAVCSYTVWKSFELAWGGRYKFICEPIDFSNDSNAVEITKIVYLYYITKLSDLLDTVFFVFRKKQSHVSFLHVYHHTGMVILGWSATKFLPGGHGTSLGVVNSIVHTVMYSYYLLTLINTKYKKSIWWKKHITQLQIAQFLFLVLHFSTLLITPNCGFPQWIALIMVPQNLFMLMLFSDFYRKAYLKPKTIDHVDASEIINKNHENCNGHEERNEKYMNGNSNSNEYNKLK